VCIRSTCTSGWIFFHVVWHAWRRQAVEGIERGMERL
jgi:hypothetical protein